MICTPKFDELRLKTDKQLIHLANAELDLGIRNAHQALESAEDWAFAERHFLSAEKAHMRASRLIRLANVGEQEWNRLESRIDFLREMLGALSVIGSTPKEDEISLLARALWKARGCPEGLPEEDWFRAERALKSQAACVGSCV
jgi:hypothetical protein